MATANDTPQTSKTPFEQHIDLTARAMRMRALAEGADRMLHSSEPGDVDHATALVAMLRDMFGPFNADLDQLRVARSSEEVSHG